MKDDEIDEDEEADEEQEGGTGPQDLNQENGKWYASKSIGILAVLALGAFGLTYKLGYDSGKKDGGSEAMLGQLPCKQPTPVEPERTPEEDEATPPMRLKCDRELLGGRRCRTIDLPPGEKLVSVIMRTPTAAPAVLTRPMSAEEKPTGYILHVPSEFDSTEFAYRVTETGPSPLPSARKP